MLQKILLELLQKKISYADLWILRHRTYVTNYVAMTSEKRWDFYSPPLKEDLSSFLCMRNYTARQATQQLLLRHFANGGSTAHQTWRLACVVSHVSRQWGCGSAARWPGSVARPTGWCRSWPGSGAGRPGASRSSNEMLLQGQLLFDAKQRKALEWEKATGKNFSVELKKREKGEEANLAVPKLC